MNKLRILKRILRQTGADRILGGFLLFFLVCALIVLLTEPTIKTYGDALWYCFAIVTTIGFGDIVTTTFAARIVSVVLSAYAILVIAIITGIVVSYYNEIVALRKNETLTSLMDKLENLPNLSKEELENISRNVKRYRRPKREDATHIV